ncbi:MAG: type I polyketide synthase, partial [Gammaproteobacteria bacterium]
EAFSHYGLDSILGVTVVKRLNEALGIDLDTTSLFDYSTVNRLSAHIHDAHAVCLAPEPEPEPQPRFEPEPDPQFKPEPAPAGKPGVPAPIAIVGVGARYARSPDMQSLWENVANRVDLVGQATRWSAEQQARHGGDGACQHGSFLDAIDTFDPLFFSISGLEANYMDPQQRIFLEEAWKALEDAGYAGKAVEGKRCGVYVGHNGGDYQRLVGSDAPAQALWGNIGSIIPARIAYYLNLQGPAIALDSACSSSLVAMHLACQALWSGEIEMALAGGVYIQSTPWFLAAGQRAGMLSASGGCFTFDERADGFVPGEGCGVVVLKRLDDALADGDHIHGVIRASGINQDGATNGITAPSALSQERLETEVYERFGIDPAGIGLVEAHGTGTHLGDPIEFRALTSAFRKYTDARQFCAIGSIKTNIGHTTAAAGVAGVIKVLGALRYRQLPPSIRFENGNPNIRFADSPFYVNTQLQPWNAAAGVARRAAVSAFGLSGTNAHMVIEEAPASVRRHAERPGYLVALSARSAAQLRRQLEQLHAHCRAHPELDCGNLSFTLLTGRKHLAHRWACIVRDLEELRALVTAWLAGQGTPSVRVAELEEQSVRLPDALAAQAHAWLDGCQAPRDASAYGRDLAALTDLYLQGYELDFGALFAGAGYTRLSLPTYPFAQGRYWVPSQPAPAAIDVPERALAPPASAAGESDPALLDGTVMLTAVWDPVAIDPGAAATGALLMIGASARLAQRAATLGQTVRTLDIASDDTVETIMRKLSGSGPIQHLVWCAPELPIVSLADEALLDAQEAGLYACFRLVKALLNLGYAASALALTVVTTRVLGVGSEEVNPAHAGLHGFMGSLAKENPAWKLRVADMETADDWPLEQILALPPCARGDALAYRAGEWHRQKLVPCKLPATHHGLYKRGGVYVVIGGAGGIGAAWSEHVVREYGAQVVWIGRRRQDEAIDAQCARLGAFGPAPHYIAADAARRGELEDACRAIKERFGRIDGIVHSAIALTDKSIANMSEGRFRTGLAAKIDVCARLAQVFGREPLDFVLFFSSIITFTKAAGQSNYAAGCTFKDSFAQRLAQEWPCKVRVMNWGYWGGVGVVASDEYRKRMDKLGVASLELPEAMGGLDSLLAGPLERVAMLKTARPIAMAGVDTSESVEFHGAAAGPAPHQQPLHQAPSYQAPSYQDL